MGGAAGMTFTEASPMVQDVIDTARAPDGTRTGARRMWTGAEVKRLREAYPAGGLVACLPLLPGRSAKAIYAQASHLGLASPREGRPGRNRWPQCPRIDDAIRRAWPSCTERRAVLRLAQAIGRPSWWVTKRARAMGLLVARHSPAAWSEAEMALLRQHGGKGLEAVHDRFRRAGFSRSITAIAVKLKREGIRRERTADGLLSVAAIMEIMGVDRTTVLRWIERGWLKARKSGKGETSSWCISPRELRQFAQDHVGVWDIRKVEKFAFVEILTTGKLES